MIDSQIFYNFGKACKPIISQFAALGRLIQQLNERRDFQLLVISIKARQQSNPYRFFVYQLVVRCVKSGYKDRSYWIKLLYASIRDRKQLKVYLSREINDST